jgi:hypothetical protein
MLQFESLPLTMKPEHWIMNGIRNDVAGSAESKSGLAITPTRKHKTTLSIRSVRTRKSVKKPPALGAKPERKYCTMRKKNNWVPKKRISTRNWASHNAEGRYSVNTI